MRHGLVLPVIEQTSCYGKHNAHLMEDPDEAFLFHCRFHLLLLGRKYAMIKWPSVLVVWVTVQPLMMTWGRLWTQSSTMHMGTGPYLLNVEICPTSQRRAQVSEWVTTAVYTHCCCITVTFSGVFMVNQVQSITVNNELLFIVIKIFKLIQVYKLFITNFLHGFVK